MRMTDPEASLLTPARPGREPEAADAGQIRNGAHARFVLKLFERYRDSLMRHLTGLLQRRADAEDVLQETCVRLLRAGDLDRTGSRARAYMFRIATNLAYDRFRARPTERLDDDGEGAEVTSFEHQPELIVSFADALDIVRKTLLELKPRCRQVFLLRASEELAYEEIAERLGVSKRTVEREMRHALEVLQNRLKR